MRWSRAPRRQQSQSAEDRRGARRRWRACPVRRMGAHGRPTTIPWIAEVCSRRPSHTFQRASATCRWLATCTKGGMRRGPYLFDLVLAASSFVAACSSAPSKGPPLVVSDDTKPPTASKPATSSSDVTGSRSSTSKTTSTPAAPVPVTCTTDKQCGGAGRICEPDKCIKGCRDDSGCATNQTCQNNNCVKSTPPGGCPNGDVDCALGNICTQSTCVPGCRGSFDCPLTTPSCNANGQCEVDADAGSSSTSSGSSPAGLVGPCQNDDQCNPTPSGQVCEGAVCVAGCHGNDLICPGAQLCSNNTCQ
jgi:hypothetical protein